MEGIGGAIDGEPAGGPSSAEREVELAPGLRQRRLVGPLAPGLAAGLVGLVVRSWQVAGRAPAWWQDSDDYLAVGGHSFWSLDLWAGARPPLVPLLLRLTGGKPGMTFVSVQAMIAAACWGWLAGEVSRLMPSKVTRWLAAAVVLGFSLTTPISMWDRSVLSESLTLSLLAATTAAMLQVLRTSQSGWAFGIVGVVAIWATARDTVAIMLLTGAVVVFVAWARGSRVDRRVPLAALAVVAVAVAASWGASTGGRGRVPLANAMFVRVLPYEDRVEWFGDHGMPNAEYFRGRAAVTNTAQPNAPVVAVARDDGAFEEWWEWLERDGESTYTRFLATHPGYLISDLRQNPERTFNNAEGDLAFYRAVDTPEVPFITPLLWFSTPAAVAATGLLALWWLGAGRPSSPLLQVAGLLIVVAGPYSFAAWHSDGMETARHIFVGGASLRLGVLVAVLAVVAARSETARHGEDELSLANKT